jgi:hypothetical protein
LFIKEGTESIFTKAISSDIVSLGQVFWYLPPRTFRYLPPRLSDTYSFPTMLKITALLCVMTVALVCANPTVQKEKTGPVVYSNSVHEEPKPLASLTWYTGSYCNGDQYSNTCDGLCYDKRANYQTHEVWL